MIGEAVTTTAHSHGRRTPLSRSAVPNAARNTAPNHTRGSVSTPPPNQACGSPKNASAGRYGLYAYGPCAVARALARSYGVPWCRNSWADRMTTLTSGWPIRVEAIQASGISTAPVTLIATASGSPRRRPASATSAARP